MAVPAWPAVNTLRRDVREGQLKAHEFAADLHGVRTGETVEVYRDPVQFFARTYPTTSLKTLVAGVLERLAGQGGEPLLCLQVTYGGGKTHTLITLLHLAEHGADLASQEVVREFATAARLNSVPRARVALLPFDKFDAHLGLQVFGPDGACRQVHTPWGALAYQLGGEAGLARVAEHEAGYTAPAEPVLADLLKMPGQDGLGTLVLLDEAVMYCRSAASVDPARLGILQDFFQVLTQAVTRVPRAAMVATLISSDLVRTDPSGSEVLRALEGVFHRVTANGAPVDRGDVAEILRRRLFESVAGEPVRRQVATAMLKAMQQFRTDLRPSQLDDAAYHRLLSSYPFHPDLIEVLYQKWTQLPKFQRTRGALRLLASALRDAEAIDKGVFVGPRALLAARNGVLSSALVDLVQQTDEGDAWTAKLEGELQKAWEAQKATPTLTEREVEQAVVATFLHSQPAGQSADQADLTPLLCHPVVDAAAITEGLAAWRRSSWFLADRPGVWQLTTNPNLTHMHERAMASLDERGEVEPALRKAVQDAADLRTADPGVVVHPLPSNPGDVKDNTPELRFAILGPDEAVPTGGAVPARVTEYIRTTGAGSPRQYPNAVICLVPDQSKVEAARVAVRRWLGWERLRDKPYQSQMTEAQRRILPTQLTEARQAVPGAVRAAYALYAALDEGGNVQVRGIPPAGFSGAGGAGGGGSGTSAPDTALFSRIRQDLQGRERIVVSGIDPELLLPGSELSLWAEGDLSKRVTDLVGAFMRFARLPRLLRPDLLRESVARGVQDGTFCVRLVRPNETQRVWWRTLVGPDVWERAEAEVVPISAVALGEKDLAPERLAPDALPGLWAAGRDGAGSGGGAGPRGPTQGKVARSLPLVTLAGYFDGRHAPRVDDPTTLVGWVRAAVGAGVVALSAGERTYVVEDVPDAAMGEGALGHGMSAQPDGWTWRQDAVLLPMPAPVLVEQVLPDYLRQAWHDGRATLAGIAGALAGARGEPAPWSLLVRAVEQAVRRETVVLDAGTPAGPWREDQAAAVRLSLPEITHIEAEALVGSEVAALWAGTGATPSIGDIGAAIARSRGRRVAPQALRDACAEAVRRRLVQLTDGGAVPAAVTQALAVRLRRAPKMLLASGNLQPRELQVLGRQAAEIIKLAPAAQVEFTASVTIKGDLPPEVRQQLQDLLDGIKAGWVQG